ncbi:MULTISPECIES: hypothetical protein [Rhizobium]|uniref:Uncharacterized protein n=1 Tax=Rhizobium esperanzae TaxID=1967781 RepID=A0A7W6US81_9HYPH|nr:MULTISPECIES: hypothetical protein [Rhizobium]MBB4443383.1 hypothetical protein [Rhizobium esperanzae]MDH6206087.1 hypothetical protein [Rhizobium leguminosarum]
MPKAFLDPHMRLSFTAILALLTMGLRPAAGLPRCPPQDELLAKAEVVVEARVKSLSIGESGLLLTENFPSRMVRADLEIKRVIKGKFLGKEATVYGAVYPPGPFRELTAMALSYGFDGRDTFEWELSRREIGDDVALFSMNACNYHKFPDGAVAPR